MQGSRFWMLPAVCVRRTALFMASKCCTGTRINLADAVLPATGSSCLRCYTTKGLSLRQRRDANATAGGRRGGPVGVDCGGRERTEGVGEGVVKFVGWNQQYYGN